MTTLRRTLAYPLFFIALLLIAGTAFAQDDTSAKKLTFRMDEPTVSISGNGTALVRGADVTAIADGSMTAKTVWRGATLTWTIDTDSETSYVDASGDRASRSAIEVGDTVSFSGMLEGSLTVDADTVRNWSDDDDNRTHLTGTVARIGSGSFVIESGNRRVTVDVDSDTEILIGKETSRLADLETGMKVRITGHYDDDEFVASSVTAIALHSRNDKPWRPILDFWTSFKTTWEHK